MKTNKVVKKSIFILSIIIVALTGVIKATTGEAGSENDPLVTKSYVDKLISQLKSNGTSTGTTIDTTALKNELEQYINQKLATQQQNTGQNQATSNIEFVAIELSANAKLICKAGAEVILRSGSAVAIDNATGDGLSDITDGKNISNNIVVEKNHLLIIPKTDGRGIKATTKSWVMVKGKYEIK